MEPQIVLSNFKGYHNTDTTVLDRLEKSKLYRDLSTVVVIPTRGLIHAKVVQNWMMMMNPMNQRFARIFVFGLEVGAAYQKAFEMILDHPVLSQFKYVLTLEDDNMPPSDGLLRLYEHMDEYDVVGGLYWGKGEEGFPMIFGDPATSDFVPQKPIPGELQQANGLGMGFNLFKLDIFKDERLEKPWFKTVQAEKHMTQDLYFYEKAGALGYKFAVDNSIGVGHYDKETDTIW